MNINLLSWKFVSMAQKKKEKVLKQANSVVQQYNQQKVLV
jgi:hypothetical protein